MIKEQVFNANISRKYFKIFSLRNYLIEFSNMTDKLSLVAKHALSVEIIEERQCKYLKLIVKIQDITHKLAKSVLRFITCNHFF